MSLDKVKLAVLSLIIANIIWGAAFPIYKWTLEVIPPFTFAFLRFFLGALIILPFAYKNLYFQRRDIPWLILLSLLSVTFLIPLLFLGLKLSPSINAPIIISSGPVFLIIGAWFFLKDKVTSKVLGGTLLSLLGVMVIIFRPFIEAGLSGGILGNFLIFLATLCSVAQALTLKKLTERNNLISIVFWMFLIGSIPLLVPIFLKESSYLNFSLLNNQAFWGILYGVIFASVIAHLLLTFGIKYIKASEIGVFSYVDPIATILVAIPLLGEKVTSTYIAGAFLVFLGIFIAEKRIHYHPLSRLLGK